MKITKVKMIKLVYFDILILDINKTLTYKFWYDYIKPKYSYKAKLCYMDTDSFIIHIKAEEFYKCIANAVTKLFDICNYNKLIKYHIQ